MERENPGLDESDDTMFTDSFAPSPDPLTDPVPADDEDALDEIEELLPKGEPTDGPAPLP